MDKHLSLKIAIKLPTSDLVSFPIAVIKYTLSQATCGGKIMYSEVQGYNPVMMDKTLRQELEAAAHLESVLRNLGLMHTATQLASTFVQCRVPARKQCHP